MWKAESISSKNRNKIRMSTLTTITQHSFGSSSYSNQRRKRSKENTNCKREVKLSLFADDMVLYTNNPKDATRKLLELISASAKLQFTKLTHRNLLHFYTLTRVVLFRWLTILLTSFQEKNYKLNNAGMNLFSHIYMIM